MKKLYAYELDCGRMGQIQGLFIATEEQIIEATGKQAYFDEALGKHSEIWDDDFISNLTIKSEDQNFIEKVEELLGSSISGFNPLNYLR